MNYTTIEHLKDSDFKRLTGVQRETFEQMLTVIEKGLRDFGRPPKLSRADQLLMTLMYWREYRTEFHIAQSYGVSEATVCRTIRKVEDVLVRSKKFQKLRMDGNGCCNWFLVGSIGWSFRNRPLA